MSRLLCVRADRELPDELSFATLAFRGSCTRCSCGVQGIAGGIPLRRRPAAEQQVGHRSMSEKATCAGWVRNC